MVAWSGGVLGSFGGLVAPRRPGDGGAPRRGGARGDDRGAPALRGAAGRQGGGRVVEVLGGRKGGERGFVGLWGGGAGGGPVLGDRRFVFAAFPGPRHGEGGNRKGVGRARGEGGDSFLSTYIWVGKGTLEGVWRQPGFHPLPVEGIGLPEGKGQILPWHGRVPDLSAAFGDLRALNGRTPRTGTKNGPARGARSTA